MPVLLAFSFLFLRSSVPYFPSDLSSLHALGVVFRLFLRSSVPYFLPNLFSLPALGFFFPLTFLHSSVSYFLGDLYSLLGIAFLLTVLDFLVFALSSLCFFALTSLILIVVNALSSFSDQSFPMYVASSFHLAEVSCYVVRIFFCLTVALIALFGRKHHKTFSPLICHFSSAVLRLENLISSFE